MITEDYVSLETAKLLKEKGFDEATNRYYNAQYDQIRTVSDTFMWHWNDEEFMKRVLMDGAIAIPTLQMAMKWLRNKHDIVCNVYLCTDFTEMPPYWSFNILNQSTANVMCTAFDIKCESYERACEKSIKYCLEELI